MRYKDWWTWLLYKTHIGRLARVVGTLLCFATVFVAAYGAPPTPVPPATIKPAAPAAPDNSAAQAQASEIVQKQMASTDKMTASIEKQKASVQSQLGKTQPPAVPAGASPASTPLPFFTTTWTTPSVFPAPTVIPSCTALAEEDLKPLVEASAKARGLEVKLIRSVIKHESDSYPCAVSEKGALGLMQLMPEVAQQLGVDPLDPKQNVEGGSQYLKQLLDRYKGDVKLALAAYNAGPQRVDTDKKVPDIPETVAYVDAILKDLTQTATAKKP